MVNKILKSFLITFIIIAVFYLQGASIVILNLNGIDSKLIPAAIITTSILIGFIILFIKRISIKDFGFRMPEKESLKQLFYLIPLFLVALIRLCSGFDKSYGYTYYLASFLAALIIATSEEMYFRGFLCNIWKDYGCNKILFISSTVYALCHIIQILQNPSIIEILMNISFAFFYGVLFTEMYLITKSLVPGIIVHTLQDFSCFITIGYKNDYSFIAGFYQTIIMIILISVIHGRRRESKLKK